ncbi:flagellar protein [Rhizobium sp. ACO-34A]|nr:flagellar protein [Rhizobium sp. ACO-34A]
MKTSLTRVANESTVSRDTAYYEENIGNITTVDEFVNDYRLFSYAMKAYGLEDMTYAKAFMKKILESDLTDDSSFANSLTDTRYQDFAAAFNFAGETTKAQTSVQTDTLLTAYQDSFTAEEDAIQTEVDYYEKKISSITSVDQLIGDSRLRSYVLESFGLDATYTSKSYLKQVLTSDLTDPDSVANKASSDAWRELAASFSFNTDGSVNGTTVQTTDEIENRRLDYIYNASTYPSDLLYEANQAYWEKNAASATTATELVSDERLLSYVKTAFGLRDTIMASSVASLMSSESFASVYGNTELLDYFNFETDGTVTSGESALSTDQISSLASRYKTAFQEEQKAAVEDAVSNFETRIAAVTNIDDFLTTNSDYYEADDDANNDDTYDDVTEIWNVALRAYGIDPTEVTKSELRKILSSDVDDKNSYVNSLKDDRFVSLVKAFNFNSDGDTEVPLLIQSENVINDYASAYTDQKTRFLTGTELSDAKEDAEAEIEYYKTQMEKITTLDEFLADSRLTNFVLEAKGIDPESLDDEELDLRKMFESDLTDPKSYVNSLSDNTFAEIVASFNFDLEGNLSSDPVGTIQQRGDTLETVNRYLRQTLEEEQGDSSEGVRLALYFQRMAPSITSAYDILGDTALLEFFTTAYSMSDYFSSQDVEKQAATVKNFIDLEQLQDPDYVEKLVKRYTALYDTENGTTDSAALSILSGVNSISADTLLAVAQLSAK